MRGLIAWIGLVAVLGHTAVAFAGPVIVGGDDLADHGSFNTTSMENEGGWLYLEKAVLNILEPTTNITRPNDGSIAALGSASATDDSGDPGAAIRRVGLVLGKTVKFYNGASVISQFFVDLASGAEMPAMLWIPGENNDEPNTLDSDEAAALKTNAAAIASFVNTGGGLMSHGCDSDDDTCELGAYDWLSTLLPGLTVAAGCENDGASLTPTGEAAFPGLSDENIDDNAGGTCHNHFVGSLGSLRVLAVDGEGRRFILGGGAGTTIGATPGPTNTPTEVPTATSLPSTETPVVPNTPTNTPTNTRGPGGADDDGCQVVAPSDTNMAWLLLLPAALLVWRRRDSL